VGTVFEVSKKESAEVKVNSGKLRSNSKMSGTKIIFPFNRRDSTYREASIPKISYSALKMTACESSRRHLQLSLDLRKF